MATPFVSVMLLGMLWRRVNYSTAMAGLVGGLAIQILLAAGLWWADLKWHWLYVGAMAQGLTMTLIAGVTLATKQAAPAGFETLIWKPELLRRYAEGKPRPWYQQVWLWFSLYFLVWAGLYWRFW